MLGKQTALKFVSWHINAFTGLSSLVAYSVFVEAAEEQVCGLRSDFLQSKMVQTSASKIMPCIMRCGVKVLPLLLFVEKILQILHLALFPGYF